MKSGVEMFILNPTSCVSTCVMLRYNVRMSMEAKASIRLLYMISFGSNYVGAQGDLTSLNQIFM